MVYHGGNMGYSKGAHLLGRKRKGDKIPFSLQSSQHNCMLFCYYIYPDLFLLIFTISLWCAMPEQSLYHIALWNTLMIQNIIAMSIWMKCLLIPSILLDWPAKLRLRKMFLVSSISYRTWKLILGMIMVQKPATLRKTWTHSLWFFLCFVQYSLVKGSPSDSKILLLV